MKDDFADILSFVFYCNFFPCHTRVHRYQNVRGIGRFGLGSLNIYLSIGFYFATRSDLL